jgi:predicted transcriptional regulator
METQDIRNKIKKYADELSVKNLNIADEFISYLANQESEEATQELLEIPGLLEDIKQGLKDIEEGNLVEWRELRNDV